MHRPLLLDKLVTHTATRFLRRIHRITHRMPTKLVEIQRQRVLVLAPHSDDEVIGVAGCLALHNRVASSVRVAYITSDPTADPGLPAAKRVEEAKRVAEYLDFEPHFLGFPDGNVSTYERDVSEDIQRLLRSHRPDVLFCPFPGDHHRDHQATAAAAAVAAERCRFGGQIWSYELWSTMWPNSAVDISDVVDVKRKAINTYESQVGTMPYADSILGLNRYRGLRMFVPYAEALFVCSSRQFSELTGALATV